MVLTKENKVVLKILVEKEIEQVKKEGKQIFISNSPFLNKIIGDEADLPFLKSEVLYQNYLEVLLKKL